MAHASFPPAERWLDRLTQQLLEVIVHVPATAEPASPTPDVRARAIIRRAALTTAGTSGTLALPPGPWGTLTVLPDLVTVWKMQAQMVADIAGPYGQAVRDMGVRFGDRLLIRRVPGPVLQRTLRQIGLRMTRRLAGRTVSRWLPVVGALGVAAYVYRDTRRVGRTAMDLFSREVEAALYEMRWY